MAKVRLVLMFEGKVDNDFITKMEVPKKNELITIVGINDGYLDYKVEFIQHFLNRFGDFQYIMVTAIRKE
jgi:hypothetical protein